MGLDQSAGDTDKTVLQKAQMSELARLPVTSNAKELVNVLLRRTLDFEAERKLRKQSWRADDLENFRIGLGAVVGDLLVHAANVDAKGFMYRGADRTAFSGTYCSSHHFERLADLWVLVGWLEQKKGFYSWEDWEGESTVGFGKCRRLRATQELLEVAGAFGIGPHNASEHFAKDSAKTFPVQVRSIKKRTKRGVKEAKLMRPPKSPKLLPALGRVRELNQFVAQHGFNLEEPPQFKRLFNNGDDPSFDYNLGGRLYCTTRDNYQTKKKHERQHMTIDGEAVVEVDVSGSFPTIYHWSCGEQFDPSRDIYLIEGIERSVVKRIAVACLSTTDWPTQWPRGLKEDYCKETGSDLARRYKLKDVVAAVRSALPILEQRDQSVNGWAQLQYWESEAILKAVEELKNSHSVVALPVFDSLIVPSSHQQQAVDAIQSSYLSQFGSSPRVKVQGLTLSI